MVVLVFQELPSSGFKELATPLRVPGIIKKSLKNELRCPFQTNLMPLTKEGGRGSVADING